MKPVTQAILWHLGLGIGNWTPFEVMHVRFMIQAILVGRPYYQNIIANYATLRVRATRVNSSTLEPAIRVVVFASTGKRTKAWLELFLGSEGDRTITSRRGGGGRL